MKFTPHSADVEAFRIASIQQSPEGQVPPHPRTLRLDGHDPVTATSEMLSRHTPAVGDYYVIQPDGYIYLAPKDVFESRHKAHAAAPTTAAPEQSWPRKRWQPQPVK
jgi:hypothetical protein